MHCMSWYFVLDIIISWAENTSSSGRLDLQECITHAGEQHHAHQDRYQRAARHRGGEWIDTGFWEECVSRGEGGEEVTSSTMEQTWSKSMSVSV